MTLVDRLRRAAEVTDVCDLVGSLPPATVPRLLAEAADALDAARVTPAIEHLRDRLTEPDDPPGLREIAAAVVELADMLRARRPAP